MPSLHADEDAVDSPLGDSMVPFVVLMSALVGTFLIGAVVGEVWMRRIRKREAAEAEANKRAAFARAMEMWDLSAGEWEPPVPQPRVLRDWIGPVPRYGPVGREHWPRKGEEWHRV